jgi:hypothetical protein
MANLIVFLLLCDRGNRETYSLVLYRLLFCNAYEIVAQQISESKECAIFTLMKKKVSFSLFFYDIKFNQLKYISSN